MNAKRAHGFRPYLVSRVQAESAVVALQLANPASVIFSKITALRVGLIVTGGSALLEPFRLRFSRSIAVAARVHASSRSQVIYQVVLLRSVCGLLL
jgi:hypothetical protein